MSYFDGDEWLDGPGLVAWLEEHGFVSAYHPNATRRVYDWRHGGRASLRAVEPMILRLGYHPSELPDDLWGVKQDAGGVQVNIVLNWSAQPIDVTGQSSPATESMLPPRR